MNINSNSGESLRKTVTINVISYFWILFDGYWLSWIFIQITL